MGRVPLLLLLGLLGTLAAANRPEIGPVPPSQPAPDPAADLRLVATQPPGLVPTGSPVGFGLKLVNTSKTVTHRVVKPGDGSDRSGGREPYLSYTATLTRPDGTTAPVPEAPWAGCGLYDWAWGKDVIELKPGAELPLDRWVPAPRFDFQQPGRVTVRAHYAFRGKAIDAKTNPGSERMAGVPAFELVSDPASFEVVKPLEVRVRVKRPLRVGEAVPTPELLEVQVVRPGPADIPEAYRPRPGSGGMFGFEVRGDSTVSYPGPREVSGYVNPLGLSPGGSVRLFADLRMTYPRSLGTWTGLKPGTFQVRAAYWADNSSSGSPVFKSEWAEVRVEPGQ